MTNNRRHLGNRGASGSRLAALAVMGALGGVLLIAVSILRAAALPSDGGLAEQELAARRERIAKMTSAEKQQLAARQERYVKLDPAQKAKLLALYDAIQNSPRRDELLRVMSRYGQWLRELTPEDRTTLLTTEASKRLPLVHDFQQKQHQKRLAQANWKMDPVDVKALRAWSDEIADRHLGEVEQHLNGWERNFFTRAKEEHNLGGQRMLVWKTIAGGKLPGPTDDDRARLVKSLTPARQELYQKSTPEERERLISTWTMAATAGGFRQGFRFGPPPSRDELEKLLMQLPEEKRQRLLRLSPDSMKRELESEWREKFGRGRGGRGGPDGRPRGSEGRGPDGRGAEGRPEGRSRDERGFGNTGVDGREGDRPEDRGGRSPRDRDRRESERRESDHREGDRGPREPKPVEAPRATEPDASPT
jgi:hypothetical protein